MRTTHFNSHQKWVSAQGCICIGVYTPLRTQRQTRQCPIACWDTHPLPIAIAYWDTPPSPNACWDTPPPVNRITDRCKNITFLQFRLQAVMIVSELTDFVDNRICSVDRLTLQVGAICTEKMPLCGRQATISPPTPVDHST